MIGLLLGIILILIILNLFQYRKRRSKSRELSYIHHKLALILKDNTTENLLLFTNDPELQLLLNDLNVILEHNREMTGSFTRKESSIKKMLANMSHDLKTPLTVVLGLTETISHDHTITDEERKRLLHKVHDKAQEILSLMNKFFDLARLESGDKELPLSLINLNEICINNILFFHESIVSQGIEAVVEIPQTLHFALANAEALDRILNNLISNSLRYGADGKVIGITLRSDADQLFIDVWDRGKGISEPHHKLIFERLFTLEDSRNHAYQGSGLGLTITKRLVELIGGKIQLQSIPYEKTVFTIVLRKF
ncbi:sensor histidine kinase [Paenibacillus psychroresistens]|uniref:histidine kinase n=1 Tax=Paenibacillus psychroresistens TaxID=1778678 RepID=A0A6B8RUD5_9BACL|nr:sensor histidine kinase [Paenibacillus psychroresistens]QGR00032.1 sensor histidine kinase [Paenibacillus psychroresistens]